ncbi:MAG: YciI family protein [Spirochaetes bacterium]|nr:YciI family protein [Spirochaetota bacterium]
MSKYIIAYHGGKNPSTPEEGAKGMEKWQAWITNLGDAIINPGTPLSMNKTVSKTGISDPDESQSLSGYTIVQAENMDKALQMAQSCPFLEMGTLEVAQVMEMKQEK